MKNEKDQWLDELVNVIQCLESPQEIRQFLQEIMTEEELDRIPRRLQVILALLEKKSYIVIHKSTNASSYMISRANRQVVEKGMSICQTIKARIKKE